ncbi:MAG: hypothetical protein K0S47_1479 [Herbinix sp.]|jgi:putative Mn2+ efflux pump MntP|nr:hypothetical protein [Herbinix sp.]
MDIITLFLLAIGLSADAFAVSITNGMSSRHISKKNVLATAFTFGFFQAAMPTIGFLLGRTFSEIICRYQHWVALFLLGAIGVNMVIDSIKERKNPESCSMKNIFTMKNLVLQGIATSIDALAAGVSLAVMEINIFTAVLFIGVVTFVCCSIGVYIGKRFGCLLGVRAKLLGGIILIMLGIKIFIETQFLA